MSLPSPLYTDNALGTAAACGAPVFRSPLPGIKAQYVFDQEWMQTVNGFTPASIGGPSDIPITHPDSSWNTYYLVAESPRQDMGAGLCKWTRTYAKVPSDHDEWEHYVFRFPGIWETSKSAIILPGIAVYGRLPITQVVMSRVENKYYLVGVGLTYTNANQIPFVRKFNPYVDGIPGQYVESVADSASYFGLITLATVPTATTYKSYVSDATTNAWSATTGQIAAEDSRLERWIGNIYRRQARYVLAI